MTARASRFEVHEALEQAMDRTNELAKQLGQPDEITVVGYVEHVCRELGLDVDVDVLLRRVTPRGQRIGGDIARQFFSDSIRSGKPLELEACGASAWITGCIEGFALALVLAERLEGGDDGCR